MSAIRQIHRRKQRRDPLAVDRMFDRAVQRTFDVTPWDVVCDVTVLGTEIPAIWNSGWWKLRG